MQHAIYSQIQCCDFTDVYHEYFTKGCARVSELLPRVEKYREQIAHAKLQFKETQEARKLNMDETGKAKVLDFTQI